MWMQQTYHRLLKNVCDPETTLFIVASKTFSTQETMTNAFSARDWFIDKAKNNEFIKNHFVAISSNAEAVKTLEFILKIYLFYGTGLVVDILCGHQLDYR